MSRQSTFVQKHLDDLIRNDPDIQRYFTQEDGKPLPSDSTLYQQRRNQLEQTLQHAYDTHGERYNKRSFLQKYIATPLRYISGGLYAAGTALFIGLPGPAGFGLTGLGALSSTLADVIDSYTYVKQGQLKKGRVLEIAGEDLITKPLAYLPIGTGLLDLYRGRRKFDEKMEKDMKTDVYAILSYAKQTFLDHAKPTEEPGRIIPISAFRDSRYAKPAMRKAA